MKDNNFYLDALTGTLKDSKRKADFTREFHALLDKYCDGRWSYDLPDEGMWNNE
jgi:hypothetical protein